MEKGINVTSLRSKDSWTIQPSNETPFLVARRDYTQRIVVQNAIIMAELQLAIKARALIGVHKPARLYRSICK